MSSAQNTLPILLGLDGAVWKEKVDRAETWFGNVLQVQGAFRRLAGSTRDKVREPHIRDYLGEIFERAAEHERKAEELFGVIGRGAPASRRAGESLVSGAHWALGKVEGAAGGATGAWQDLRQLLLLNLDSMGAFAVAEQIGFALVMPEISDNLRHREREDEASPHHAEADPGDRGRLGSLPAAGLSCRPASPRPLAGGGTPRSEHGPEHSPGE